MVVQSHLVAPMDASRSRRLGRIGCLVHLAASPKHTASFSPPSGGTFFLYYMKNKRRGRSGPRHSANALMFICRSDFHRARSSGLCFLPVACARRAPSASSRCCASSSRLYCACVPCISLSACCRFRERLLPFRHRLLLVFLLGPRLLGMCGSRLLLLCPRFKSILLFS